MKKRLKLLLAISLCIPPILSVHATEFEGKEDQYTEMCKKTDQLSKEDIKTCEEFTSYLKEKNKEPSTQCLVGSTLCSYRSYLSIELQPLLEGNCLISDLAENIEHVFLKTEFDLKIIMLLLEH